MVVFSSLQVTLTSFLLSHCSGQIDLRAEFNHLAEEYSLEHYKLYTAHSKFTLHKYSFNSCRNFADPLSLPGILVFARTINKEYMHTYKPQMEKNLWIILICGENACLAPFKECRHLEKALCSAFSRGLLTKCLVNGTLQIHSKTIGRHQAINCGTICGAYYSANELPKLGFLSNAKKR